MFRRGRQPQAKGGSEPFTYIHHGTKITGDLAAAGRVRVHGTILGNVKVEGILEIAEAGLIEGQLIQAQEVKILGRVKANIHTSGKIEIWRKGRLEGDVRAAALDIEEGASFIGRSEMASGSEPTPPPVSRSSDVRELRMEAEQEEELTPGASVPEGV